MSADLLDARAGRIRFVAGERQGEHALRFFPGPHPATAVEEMLDVESLLAEAATAPDVLRVVLLPAGSSTSPEAETRVREWLLSEATPAGGEPAPLAETTLRNDRIYWRAGRAVIIGAPERWQENLEGVLELAYYEGQLRQLEIEIAADWLTAEADIPLTHSVSSREAPRREHVDEMTRRVTQRRLRFAWLEPRLEKPSLALAGPSRRVFVELGLQADLVDRARAVDDRLEVCEDLYELANDRLSEFSYFRREYRLEVWILLALAVEVIIMLIELRMGYLQYLYELSLPVD